MDHIVVPHPLAVVPHWYMYSPKTSYSEHIPNDLIERKILKLSGNPVSVYVPVEFRYF